MSKSNIIKIFRSHKGQVMYAEYYEDPDMSEFQGNPVVESLPNAFETETEVQMFLERLPVVEPKDLALPPLKKILKLGNARHFYIPVQRAVNLALDFDTMLRWGLVNRNPFDAAYVRKIHKGYDEFDVKNYDASCATPVGIVLMGFGGTGKTQTILRILRRYPQVIKHSCYQGRKLTLDQVVWLKLDCPEGGGRKGLLIAIFQALDSVLGTTYFEDCAKYGKAGIEVMMPQAANVLQNHHLGALVIDEFQNFYGSQEGVLTLRFLRRLNNELGVPIVLIGTPDAEQTMIGQFSLLRRASAYGNHDWREMKIGKDGIIGDWDVFFAALSQYCYLEGKFDYNAVSSALHEVTGGIPDLGVVIWIAVQNRILRAGKSKEITASGIHQVAESDFPWIGDAVAALKEGTEAAYRRYSDLYFRHFKPQKGSTVDVPSDTASDENDGVVGPQASSTPSDEVKRKIKPLRQREITSLGGPELKILSIVDAGKKTQKSAYQSLFDAGFIGSVDRFLK